VDFQLEDVMQPIRTVPEHHATVSEYPNSENYEPKLDPDHDQMMTKTAGAILYIVSTLGKVFGQYAMNVDKITEKMEFKLFSCKSLLTLIKLLVFSLPFTMVPSVFHFWGLIDEEWENFVESNNITCGKPESQKTREIVTWVDYISNFSYYVLPFLFAYYMTEPLDNINQISKKERKFMKRKSIAQLIPPIVAFILYALGSFLQTTAHVLAIEAECPGFSHLPLNVYSMYGRFVLSSLGLQFLLSSYEFYFYRFCHDHNEMVDNLMKTTRKEDIFIKVKNIMIFMENFQHCFGIFLLFDLSLMFLYWLIHLYRAYFTFQESSLAASGSVLIILAELWRVVLISNACENFTEKVNRVIRKYKDELPNFLRISFTNEGLDKGFYFTES
jgi:hypothetical protein